MTSGQLNLLSPEPDLPSGARYEPDVITPEEESGLLDAMASVEFRPFEFQGFIGDRRVASFGWRFAFDGSGLHPAEPIPDFLLPVRDAAGGFAGLDPTELEQVLLTEYASGAAIGWHRDRPVFGDVVGISLLSPARLRFRRKRETKWERMVLMVQPRSAYLLTGAARSEWEHSIPAVEAKRYSITFRTLRA